MSYLLTKNHVACHDRPVLLDHELLSGPYDAGSSLPGYENAGTVKEIVARALEGKERRPNDPRIDVDAGADREAYMRQFLAPVPQGNPRLG